MSVTTEPCGCKHNGTHWLYLCPPCKEESDGMHDAAMRGVSYDPKIKTALSDSFTDLMAWGQGICEVFPDGTVEHVPTEDWLNIEERK